MVDRLLASPRYGERWGRHWLDVARYADSDGFKADATRPHIWRYRDYVIKAFNDDKPYDRFVREQIAGDELFPGDPEALVAMGFNRHWIDETNAAGLLTRRQETLDDMTNVTGATFLGLTMRLRALPRPQDRSDHAQGLLPTAGVLREHVVRRRPAAVGGSRRAARSTTSRRRRGRRRPRPSAPR